MNGVAYGLAGTAVFIVLLLLASRLYFKHAPGIPFLLIEWVLVGILTATAVSLLEPVDRIVLMFTNLAVYAFFVEALIFIYGVASGSVSVGIMTSMVTREELPDAFERALAEHSASRLFEYRLQRLSEQRLLVQSGDEYTLTAKGRRWAAIGSGLKALLAVGSGG